MCKLFFSYVLTLMASLEWGSVQGERGVWKGFCARGTAGVGKGLGVGNWPGCREQTWVGMEQGTG